MMTRKKLNLTVSESNNCDSLQDLRNIEAIEEILIKMTVEYLKNKESRDS